MKILKKYILKELLGPSLLCLIVITMVMFTAKLLRLTDLVINKGVSFDLVGNLFAGMIVFLLGYTIPMSLLTSILLVFGRLSADNEICAIRASGISVYRIMIPVIFLSFFVSLGSVILNDQIIPRVRFSMKKIVSQISQKNPLAVLEAGTFINNFANYVLFFRDIEGNKVKDIIIYEPQAEKNITRVIMANEGTFIPLKDGRKGFLLRLVNGTIEEPDPKQERSSYSMAFKTYETELNFSEQHDDVVEKKLYHMTTAELLGERKKMKALGVGTGPIILEINKKFSLAFSAFALCMVGLPLAIKTHKSEKSINFALSLLLMIIYYIFFAAGEALAQKGVVSPYLGTWLVDILFVVLGIGLIARVSKS